MFNAWINCVLDSFTLLLLHDEIQVGFYGCSHHTGAARIGQLMPTRPRRHTKRP